jgi:hypothetical protein
MTHLEPGDNPLKRLVKVYGIPGDIEVSISHEGVSMRVPGSRQSVTATWDRVVSKATQTPSNVPCWLAHDGTKLLQHEATKAALKKEKKEAKLIK